MENALVNQMVLLHGQFQYLVSGLQDGRKEDQIREVQMILLVSSDQGKKRMWAETRVQATATQ